jgi:hypothetical protein
MILAQTALPVDISKFISDPEIALLIGILVAAIYGAHKKWWVPGWLYTKAEERGDKLQDTVDTLKPIMKDQHELLKDIAADLRRRE